MAPVRAFAPEAFLARTTPVIEETECLTYDDGGVRKYSKQKLDAREGKKRFHLGSETQSERTCSA